MDLVEIGDGVRRHPWELARYTALGRIIRDVIHDGVHFEVLDVGSGDGYFAGRFVDDFPRIGRFVAYDPMLGEEDLRVMNHEKLEFVNRVPERMFDLVLLLDVLEHIDDDVKFLEDTILKVVKPSSFVLISVPSYQSLFSHHDTFLGHKRRYSPSQLNEVAGVHLQVVDFGTMFFLPLVARYIQTRLSRSNSSDGTAVGGWKRGPIITALIEKILNCDIAIAQTLSRIKIRIPGLSSWVLCQRRP